MPALLPVLLAPPCSAITCCSLRTAARAHGVDDASWLARRLVALHFAMASRLRALRPLALARSPRAGASDRRSDAPGCWPPHLACAPGDGLIGALLFPGLWTLDKIPCSAAAVGIAALHWTGRRCRRLAAAPRRRLATANALLALARRAGCRPGLLAREHRACRRRGARRRSVPHLCSGSGVPASVRMSRWRADRKAAAATRAPRAVFRCKPYAQAIARGEADIDH